PGPRGGPRPSGGRRCAGGCRASAPPSLAFAGPLRRFSFWGRRGEARWRLWRQCGGRGAGGRPPNSGAMPPSHLRALLAVGALALLVRLGAAAVAGPINDEAFTWFISSRPLAEIATGA